MVTVAYHPSFIRQFKKLPLDLQQEAKEKIEIFKQEPYHPSLKTHKLNGRMKEQQAFSVNYSWRIIFEIDKNEALFLEIGTHELYK